MGLRLRYILTGLFLLTLLGMAATDAGVEEQEAELDSSELEIFNFNQKRDLDLSNMGELDQLFLEERMLVTRPQRWWCFWVAIPVPWWCRCWWFPRRTWIIVLWCWRHFWISGDPQYSTLDGRDYDFHGTCAYVLSTTTDPDMPQFTVYSENHYATATQRANRVSSPKNVMVEAYGYLIKIGQGQRVVVNGVERNLPLMFGNTTSYIAVYKQPDDVVIITDYGLYVTFNGRRRISVNLPEQFKGKIRGLIGNFDDDPDNDFMTKNGTLAADQVEFGNSWKAEELSDPTCVADAGDADTVCSPAEQVTVDEQCSGLSDPNGVFASCHPFASAERAEASCKFDMCADFGNEEFLCNTYELYAVVCEHFGVTIDWRTPTFCPMECGAHAHYEDSVPPCIPSCQSSEVDANCVPAPDDPAENVLTASGCVCDAGYLLEGNDCILCTQCGCLDQNNIYHKIGESWSDCQKTYTCVASNHIEHVSNSSCPPEWTCVQQPDASQICVCDTPACSETCTISENAILRNKYLLGTQLADDTKHQVAYTDGPAPNMACRIQIQTKITAGVVDFASVNIGVRPGAANKYYRNYAFDLRSKNGAFKRGYQIKGLKQIFFPPNPHSFSTNDFSATVQELSATTWQLDVTCDTTHMLTLTYGEPGDAYVNMVVDSPTEWSTPCYPDV